MGRTPARLLGAYAHYGDVLAGRPADPPQALKRRHAGHDCATFANQGVPSAMIFFRNDHGSHNANEAMDIGDFAQGCRLLDALLDELG